MQDDVLTLAVDELNDSNTVDHVFNRFDEYQNRSVYQEDGHELTARDTLTLFRSFPKASGNFKGVAKPAFKFSKDYLVDGVDGVASLTSPMIAEVSFSIPVGVSAADQLIMRQRLIALLDDDSIMVPLMNQLMV
jgi:hypothetical protein